ncbi:hypothetical protein ACEPAI_2617 [Sanghuangporus weigelae]
MWLMLRNIKLFDAMTKDYLTKFYSPSTEGNQSSSTDVAAVEMERLPRIWLPKAGWKDLDMDNKLLELVDDYLADCELPEPRSSWDRRFEPEIDDNHTLLSWSANNLEIHVCRPLYRHEEYASWVNQALGMVKFGAIDALGKVMASLGGPIRVTDQTVPPERGRGNEFKSKVGYVLHGERGTVLVEVKAPHLLDMLTQIFELNSFSISMRPEDSVESRIINKVCFNLCLCQSQSFKHRPAVHMHGFSPSKMAGANIPSQMGVSSITQ